MDLNTYLELLQRRLQRFFDFKEAPTDLPVALYAELNVRDEGYFLVHSLKTYSVSHDEHIFAVMVEQPLTEQYMEPYLKLIRTIMQQLKPASDHMSTSFDLVFICAEPPEGNLLEKYSKYKFHKDYMFSLRGWSDLALYFVCPKEEMLLSNRAGRKNISYYQFPK